MDSVLVLDKPLQMTSFDVVAKVRRALGERRIGHAGTLDPLATGVLVLCLGEATKLVPYLMDADKEYLATIQLGCETDTDDADPRAVVLRRADPQRLMALRDEEIHAALAPMVGIVQQRPPRFSALKVQGQRLYDKARHQRTAAPPPGLTDEQAASQSHAELEDLLDQKARPVQIHALHIESIVRPPAPQVVLRVHCGKGTYVRAIARDLGATLGVFGHLVALRRTRVGAFDLRCAVPLAQVATAPVFGLLEALSHLPRLALSELLAWRIQNGQPAALRELSPTLDRLAGPHRAVTLVDSTDRLIAIVQPADDAAGSERRWLIARGFVPAPAPIPPAAPAPL